jgi:hypothetical protein
MVKILLGHYTVILLFLPTNYFSTSQLVYYEVEA